MGSITIDRRGGFRFWAKQDDVIFFSCFVNNSWVIESLIYTNHTSKKLIGSKWQFILKLFWNIIYIFSSNPKTKNLKLPSIPKFPKVFRTTWNFHKPFEKCHIHLYIKLEPMLTIFHWFTEHFGLFTVNVSWNI